MLSSLFFLIPPKVKMYGAIVVGVLLLVFFTKREWQKEAKEKYANEIKEQDLLRASSIRSRADNARMRNKASQRGYRD